VALAQFEGTLVLVSHDRHLLRATTEALLIVTDGRVQPFDGDLDDYRDWLFKTRLADNSDEAIAPSEAAKQAPAQPAAEDRREQKRREALERQRLSAARKPLESRIKRLEETMAKLNARKAALNAQLADPGFYAQSDREAQKALVIDQAYVNRELETLEEEWLKLQEELESLAL
jgi:ATP-binding cassette subfamily F protein 3